MHILDVNGDGKNELFIGTTESDMNLFLIQDIDDVSAITAADVVQFYHLPQNTRPNGTPLLNAGLRRMDAGDPDNDGNINFFIAGEANGQIFDLEYNGTGALEDQNSWTLNIIYDLYQVAMNAVGVDTSSLLSPRLYYGDLADDMDGDGLPEYVFVNYSTDRGIWPDDRILSVLEMDSFSGVESDFSSIPQDIQLHQNFPNPFNPSTKIHFEISDYSNVKITVYDILGNEVDVIMDSQMAPGSYTVDFIGAGLSSGIYYYSLESGGKMITKEMLLLK
jgi:hypothetical protein